MSFSACASWALWAVLLLPACLAWGAPAEERFDTLFGEEAKKVAASRNKRDAVALAEKLVASAVASGDDKALQVLLCEKAVELAGKQAEGYVTVETALRLLDAAAPGRHAEFQQKELDLFELRYRMAKGEEQVTAARKLVIRLVSMAEDDLAAGKPADASGRFRRAAGLARQMKWADAPAIARKADRAAAQEDVDKQVEALAKTVAAGPKGPATAAAAKKLLMLHLTERDDPNRAAAVLPSMEADESLRSYLPLAEKEWADLTDAQCLELARWYEHLAGQAGTLGRVRMLQRAKAYYDACATLRGSRDPASAQAALAGQKVAKLLENADPPPGGFLAPPEGLSAAVLAWIKQRDAAGGAKEQVDAIAAKLADVNGGKAVTIHSYKEDERRIVELDLHDNRDLRVTSPLYGMKLQGLDLRATGVTNLSVLRGMKLSSLVVNHCLQLRGLEGLEGMPLTDLAIAGTAIISLKPLRGMKLRRLAIDVMQTLASLEGLEGVPLEELTAYECKALQGFEPLRGAPLTVLNAGKCPLIASLEGLQGMPLKTVDISECRVRSLEPLRGARLGSLNLHGCGNVRDIGPLAGAPLEDLRLTLVPVTSLLPLKGMPLKNLYLDGCGTLKSLDGIEGLPLARLSLTGTRFANQKTVSDLKKRIPTLQTVDYEK